KIPHTPSIPNTFEVNAILAKSQTFVKSLLATGHEVANADSSMLRMNRSIYLRQLNYNESKLMPLMEELNRTLVSIMEAKANEASTINAGKLISLVIALIFLAVLVLEPLFKTNRINFHELQEARNRLLKEQKYLTSI